MEDLEDVLWDIENQLVEEGFYVDYTEVCAEILNKVPIEEHAKALVRLFQSWQVPVPDILRETLFKNQKANSNTKGLDIF